MLNNNTIFKLIIEDMFVLLINIIVERFFLTLIKKEVD